MTRPTYQGIRRRSDDDVRTLRERARRDAPSDAAVTADVEAFCLFVGYARSGHTVLASILDARREGDASDPVASGTPPPDELPLSIACPRPIRR